MVSWVSQPSHLSCTHTTESRSRSRSLGVLPLKIPHLNAVQAWFLSSDEHLPLSPGHRQMLIPSGDQANVFQLWFIECGAVSQPTTSHRRPTCNLLTRTGMLYPHLIVTDHFLSLVHSWLCNLIFKKLIFIRYSYVFEMERRGLCMHSLRNLDQNTLQDSFCYLDSKANSDSSYEQWRFMISPTALTGVLRGFKRLRQLCSLGPDSLP